MLFYPDTAAIRWVAARCGEECVTVADMNRLEQAARISMGEFQDPEASTEPLFPPHHTLLWGIVLAAAATILIIALFQLT
jgi:hypothetical protein